MHRPSRRLVTGLGAVLLALPLAGCGGDDGGGSGSSATTADTPSAAPTAADETADESTDPADDAGGTGGFDLGGDLVVTVTINGIDVPLGENFQPICVRDNGDGGLASILTDPVPDWGEVDLTMEWDADGFSAFNVSTDSAPGGGAPIDFAWDAPFPGDDQVDLSISGTTLTFTASGDVGDGNTGEITATFENCA